MTGSLRPRFQVPDQSRDAGFQRLGQACDHGQRGIADSTLDHAHVGSVDACVLGQPLLRKADCLTPSADRLAQTALEKIP